MLVTIDDCRPDDPVVQTPAWAATSASYCRQLEAGHVLFLPRACVDLPAGERAFLLDQRSAVAATHKNIAYLPQQDRIIGCATRSAADRERLRASLQAYSRWATHLVTRLLCPYAASLRVDYASFRPAEEAGRALRWRSRNDLLHTDAFPARPTRGDRILRVFTNIHPTRPRRWVTTDGFDVLVRRFAAAPQLRVGSLASEPLWRRTRRFLLHQARAAGVPVGVRSRYDEFMLRFHDFLKANREFQASCQKLSLEFPPHSTWIVFTDSVPHAVLSGQHALEQTFIVGRAALVAPEKAPIEILQRLCGAPLAG